MKYHGPIGSGGGGSDDESGPSSRPKVRRAAQEPSDDSGPQPTTEELEALERRKQRSGSGVYDHWCNAMRPALEGRSASATVNRARFQANVQFLILKEGLDKARILALIDEFARRVSVGQVAVEGKEPWSIFMWMWPKLGGTASAGLAEKAERLTDEKDWL